MTFQEKQTKTNENISIATVLRQIPRLCKSGEFCGPLTRVMVTYSSEHRAGHPTGRREAISERPAMPSGGGGGE